MTSALQICPTKPKLNVSKTHPLLIQIPKISAAIWIPPKPKRAMIARKLELEEIWRDLNLLQVKYFTFYKIYKDISRDSRSTLEQAHESSGILKFKLRYLPLSVNLLFNKKESHIYFPTYYLYHSTVFQRTSFKSFGITIIHSFKGCIIFDGIMYHDLFLLYWWAFTSFCIIFPLLTK